MQRRTPALVLAALCLGTLAACGSSGGSDASSDTTAPKADETTTTAPVEAVPLMILVSNDDGVEGEGIDALAQGLAAMDDVKVFVVAPLTDQTGQGGKETERELAVTDVKLGSGFTARAVDGYPADSVRVAVDELGIDPDLLITGINAGQNLGPALDISGTVGAARAGVARGIPALATSQGTPEFDYASAVPLIVEWVETHRNELMTGDVPVEVTNLNIPSCSEGEIRGTVEVDAELTGDLVASLGAQDCTSTEPEEALTTDVEAFLNGFATFSTIPAKPAS